MEREQFDSDEEMYMFWYFQELKEKGFVNEITLHPESFILSEPLVVDYKKQLKTKVNSVPEEILKGHVYTCDLLIEWNIDNICDLWTLYNSEIRKKKGQSLNTILAHRNHKGKYISYIEVKPAYDMQNMTRLAKINQKWLFDKYGLYVNIIVPEKHFNKTFTPDRFRLTNKSKVDRKIKYQNIKTLNQFLTN